MHRGSELASFRLYGPAAGGRACPSAGASATGPLLSVAVSAAPKAHAGVVAGVVNTARMIGATLGVPCLAVSLQRTGTRTQNPAFVGGAIIEILDALEAWRALPGDALSASPQRASRPLQAPAQWRRS